MDYYLMGEKKPSLTYHVIIFIHIYKKERRSQQKAQVQGLILRHGKSKFKELEGAAQSYTEISNGRINTVNRIKRIDIIMHLISYYCPLRYILPF